MKKHVCFILLKQSIVVRGMEKKLEDYGYPTDSIIDDYDRMKQPPEYIGLFVLYLPEDIMEDAVKQRTLSAICGNIRESGMNAITVGEEKCRTELESKYPELKNHRWMSRPIDSDKFCVTIDEIMQSAVSGGSGVNGEKAEKKRILIVDDDPSYAGMVRSWIKDSYKTDIVTSGMNAITYLLKNRVDIILLDYEMPVVDGPQVLQMLRQEEATKDIPVVFLTGVSTKEGVSRVMELKPDGYILKSTTREDLLVFLAKRLG